MYHGQVMFAPVLTVEQNDPVALSKHEATQRKGYKETENNHAPLVFQILWTYQEYLREFDSHALYKKQFYFTKRKRIGSCPQG